MVCTGYDPHFVKQLDGSRYQGLNCTCASAAMSIDDDSCGDRTTTAATVRAWTGDTVGGTNLAEIDSALNSHTTTRLDVRYSYPWASFAKRVQGGAGAILQGGYNVLADSKFDAGNGFRGNHAIYVPPRFNAMDPLADGRRSGVYQYHGEAYPAALLESFAGYLNLEGNLDRPARYLGRGLVYAAFTRDNDANWRATVRPGGTTFTQYFVEQTQYGLQIRGRKKKVTPNGFQLPCTAPRLVWERPVGDVPPTTKRSVVRITAPGASMNGWWIDAHWSEEY